MEQTTIYDYLQPNFVQEIYNFNKQAGLLEKGYDDFLESSFQIEEALEGFELEGILPILENSHPHYAQSPHYGEATAKDVSRAIVTHCIYPIKKDGIPVVISDVDRLDKAIDAIVFAIGSIAKLGLNVEQIHRAIGVVTEANLQKLTMPKDEHGKLTKPAGFVGPESKLQAILDERQ